MKVKSLSRVRLLATPWTAALQAPPSMGFSRQEYWSGVPLPSPSSHVKLYYFRPAYPVEELEEETVAEDDAELTLNKVDEEFVVCVLLNFFVHFQLWIHFPSLSSPRLPLSGLVYFIVCRLKKKKAFE